MSILRPQTREAVLQRLGFSAAPPTDIAGLTALYRSWCRSVPFDNTLKLIALHGPGSGALPGMDAESFFDSWLRHSTGGTCWPSNNALSSLLRECGFRSRMVAASMADTGVASHGTTIVTLDDGDWLVDSSMLTDAPLQLSKQTATTIDHPVFATCAQPVAEGWLLQFSLPYAAATMPCRTIAPTAVTHEFCVERFEVSRVVSRFNDHPFTRRNDAAGVVSYGGGKRYRRTESGVEESDLSGNLVFDALRNELGMSDEIVAKLQTALAATH
jgi:N-hydroxyarylamine O-acetyltransferase